MTTTISLPISSLFCSVTFALPLEPGWVLWLIWPIVFGNNHTASLSGKTLSWPGNMYFLFLGRTSILSPPCGEKLQPQEEALRSEDPGGRQENPRGAELQDVWANTPLGRVTSRPWRPTWSHAGRLPSTALPKFLTHRAACKINCCIKPPGFVIVT